MGRKMERGKQQVLFGYLPGKTFDFQGVAAIARVTGIRGVPRTELNAALLLRKVAEEASAWQEEFRPVLRDDVLRDPSRFVLLDPVEVRAELFPRVFWCQNRRCGRVLDFSHRDQLPGHTCPDCRTGRLVQLRFVKVHRCGTLQSLVPPTCQNCHSNRYIALDTRGSERVSNFTWICRQCKAKTAVFGGHCWECDWPGDTNLKRMDILPHRAGSAFYAQSTVLLNIPSRELDAFLNLPEWPAIVAARYFGLPEVANRTLPEFGPSIASGNEVDSGLSGADLDDLFNRQARGELTAEGMVEAMQALRQRRQQERKASSIGGIVQAVEQRTGVSIAVWERAGQEMLEAVIPLERGQPKDLFRMSADPVTEALTQARRLGLTRLALLADFPIITATYGFTRVEYAPGAAPGQRVDLCRLNPFPAERDHGGKFPIYIDKVQADALLLSLDPDRVCTWLERNGHRVTIPDGNDPAVARRAYFVQLFDDVPLHQTLQADRPQARMVFGLLHTLSHIFVRQAALLCGLDQTSLSEYLMPRTLSFAIYCNHRSGATIGALTALFEQSLSEWLSAVQDSRYCVYDPVCKDHEGSCHTCSHLAETSCRFFNLNLNRAFLFGGRDVHMGGIQIGYFSPSSNLR